MRFRSMARRFGVVAAATGLVNGVALGGMPAGAMSVGAPGVVLAISTVGGHNVEAPLSYEVTPYTNGALVTWNCKAVATPDPASTGIGSCSVAGQQAVLSPNNMPGAVSVAAGTVFVPDGSQPTACVEGHATFLENVIGPLNVSTGEKCEPLRLITI
jgi:hypothetical protein